MIKGIPAIFKEIPDIFVVGGKVRDLILEIESNDIDLASPYKPEQILEWASAKNIKVIPTGIEHGTVTIVIDNIPYEHTTFRKDISCDGRNATVAFSDNIMDDLSRRDFTINAMALRVKDGILVDPFNGCKDLVYSELKTVGRAIDRFSEDLLRIIRAARFAARFNLRIRDPEIYIVARQLSEQLLEHVSVERIFEEFNKAFKHNRAGVFLEFLRMFGVMKYIFPEYKGANNLNQSPEHHPEGDVWTHVCYAVDACEPKYRWNAFLHDIGKPSVATWDEDKQYFSFYGHAKAGADMIPAIAERLKFPNELTESVEKTTRWHMLPFEYFKEYGSNFPDKACRRLRQRIGSHFDALKAVVKADIHGRCDGDYDELFRPIVDPVSLVLKGRHLMEIGIQPGPRMGELLKQAFEIQIEEGIFDVEKLIRRVIK